MLFYFTGTGNSLYAAKGIESELLSIPQAIHCRQLDFTDDSIGIVCPVYGHEVPPMVREFLQKAKFHTEYFYMVLTYGNRHGGAAELAQKLCSDCGIQPAYINVLLMADNWLPGFDMDEQKRLDKDVDAHLNRIAADIAARKHWIAPVTDADRAAHREFLARTSQMPADAWQHLIRVTDRCIGCGICQMVCPSASVRVKDGRAVQNPNARYRNEHIQLSEIISANKQA